MGGKNHQPCKPYIKTSTRMSRHASLAFAKLELANVSLEDLLLSEIDGKTGNIDNILEQLTSSRGSIAQLIDTADKLKDEMVQRDFRDLLTIHPVNLVAIGTALIEANMVNASAWKEVMENARTGGFYKNLAMIRDNALLLAEHTDKLIEQVSLLQQQAKDGSVTQILEENMEGNFKPSFANLYNTWARFQERFIASSLLSTEVYYAFNGYGSLVDIKAQTKIA